MRGLHQAREHGRSKDRLADLRGRGNPDHALCQRIDVLLGFRCGLRRAVDGHRQLAGIRRDFQEWSLPVGRGNLGRAGCAPGIQC